MAQNILFFTIIVGLICLISWILPIIVQFKKNVRIVTLYLIGLLSLIAALPFFMPLIYMISADSLERSLAKYASSLASQVLIFTFIFTVCATLFIILAFICIASARKISKTAVEYHFKFGKFAFLLSFLVPSATFICVIICNLIEIGYAKMSLADFFFRAYERFYIFGSICAFLILLFGIAGLALLNKKPDAEPKTLANRFLLTAISISILFVSLLPTYYAKIVVLSLLGNIVFLTCCFAAILICGAVKPEKAKNFLKPVFVAIASLYIVMTIYFLIIGAPSTVIAFALLVTALALVEFFLLSHAKISSEADIKKPINDLQAKIKNVPPEDIAQNVEVLKQKTTDFTQKSKAVYQSAFMRAKQILLNPQTEYQAIEQENTPHTKTLTSYLLPLVLISALFAFIGYGLVGYSIRGTHFSQVDWGLRMAIIQIAVLIGGIYLSTLVISFLTENFGANKNFDRVFSLIAYAHTPILLAGVFHIHHSLWWLVFLIGLYGLYLLFVGLKPMLKPAEDKVSTLTLISMAVTVVSYIVLFQVMRAIIFPQFFFR